MSQNLSKETKKSDRIEPAVTLVTGGGGFLGQAIVRMLVARGDRVRSLSRRFYPSLLRH